MKCQMRNQPSQKGSSRSAVKPPPQPPRTGAAITLAQAQQDLSTDDQQSKDNFDRVANMAREAYDIGKEILGYINIEFKRYQSQVYTLSPIWDLVTVAQSGAQTTGFYNPLYEITQSVNDDDRVGDSIKVQDYVIKARITAVSGQNMPISVRFILFWDESNQITTTFATGASVAGFLDPIGASTNMSTMCTKDYDGDAKTQILWEKVVKVDLIGSGSSALHLIEHRQRINRHTNYENNSAIINSGALKLLVLSDVASTETRPSVSFYHQVYYTDD